MTWHNKHVNKKGISILTNKDHTAIQAHLFIQYKQYKRFDNNFITVSRILYNITIQEKLMIIFKQKILNQDFKNRVEYSGNILAAQDSNSRADYSFEKSL